MAINQINGNLIKKELRIKKEKQADIQKSQ